MSTSPLYEDELSPERTPAASILEQAMRDIDTACMTIDRIPRPCPNCLLVREAVDFLLRRLWEPDNLWAELIGRSVAPEIVRSQARAIVSGRTSICDIDLLRWPGAWTAEPRRMVGRRI